MKTNYVDPTTKLLLLLLNIITVFLLYSNIILLALVIYAIFLSLVLKINILKGLKYLSYAVFLALFTFIFSWISGSELDIALTSSLRVFLIFTVIFIYSYIFKRTTTNKQTSYAISNLLRPLRPFGYNQNKVYTTFLLVLNSVFSLYSQVTNMYYFERRMYPRKLSIVKKISIIINLISPFFTKVMFKNDVSSLSLITKDYNIKNKTIKMYKPSKNNKLVVSLLIVYEIIFFILIFTIYDLT